MSDNKIDLIDFSSKVRDLMDSELGFSVGNMEILPFAEKIYKLVRAQAYNEGVIDARQVLERKLEDVAEQLEFLLRYD